MQTPVSPSTSPDRAAAWLRAATWAALAFGLVYRLAPLVLSEAALTGFFVTEDGYLMLTVARNLGIGLGLSVSEGSIATNGVQPLATFLYALPYWLVSGDKHLGIAGVLLISTAVSAGAAWAIRGFGRAALGLDPAWAGFLAALWFATPLSLFHSMNALETGLNVLVVVCAVLVLARQGQAGGHCTWAQALGFGCLLGIAFLVRNDNAILVAALLAARAGQNLAAGRTGVAGNFRDLIVPGAVSLVWAAPWLVFNHRLFGSIMPISGIAESHTAAFGSNLHLVPVKLVESMLPFLPVPGRLEDLPAVAAVCLAVVLAVLGLFLVRVFPRLGTARAALAGYLLYALGLSCYYGFLFGAPHFLSRYFAAFVPLLSGAALALALSLARRPAALTLLRGAAIASLAVGLVLLGRLALPGAKPQGHFQVVDWVRQNVPDSVWVGAVQTGTLGYWHDRTINLDGKVNPEALRAKLATGDVRAYVIGSPIAYVADWAGIAGWVDGSDPAFAQAFELAVDDPARNLAVLRRR